MSTITCRILPSVAIFFGQSLYDKKRGSCFFMALVGCTCRQMLSVQVVMNAPWASYLRSTWLCPLPAHLVHLVQDLLDGGRLSCPLDVHCIRKPVCDCRNLDVAVALSARLCSRYDAALRVRLHHDHYTSTTGSCTTCGPSCSKTKQGRALHPSCSSKTARRARQAGPNLRLGETLLLTGSDTSCTNCSQISRFSKKNGWKR